MSVSNCDLLWMYYPGFRNSTAKYLCEFEAIFIPFSHHVLSYLSEISVASILINVVHFFILTRKPMRTSSINILMAAVALFDIFTSLLEIEILFQRYSFIFFKCFPETYGKVLTRQLLHLVKDYSRRCSTWLICFIALIRTLMIRNPMSTTYESLGNPKASLFVIAGICTTSLPISIFKFFEVQFVKSPSFLICAPKGTYYIAVMSYFFLKNDGFVAKYFNLFNSIVSDIIPCILLPIVTLSLVIDLWKRAKKRANLISVSKSNSSRSKTALVLSVTIMFFIVEFPYGLSVGFLYMFNYYTGIHHILTNFSHIFSMLITLNTCTHLFVCLLLSFQYRWSIIDVLSCGYFSQKIKEANGAEVNSIKNNNTVRGPFIVIQQ